MEQEGEKGKKWLVPEENEEMTMNEVTLVTPVQRLKGKRDHACFSTPSGCACIKTSQLKSVS